MLYISDHITFINLQNVNTVTVHVTHGCSISYGIMYNNDRLVVVELLL